ALIVFFFFQAEDGIRDKLVTGVQTCALPIFAGAGAEGSHAALRAGQHADRADDDRRERLDDVYLGRRESQAAESGAESAGRGRKIGRASCRERVEISGVEEQSKKSSTMRERR